MFVLRRYDQASDYSLQLTREIAVFISQLQPSKSLAFYDLTRVKVQRRIDKVIK
jgi:hypothetical protein